jgi:DNA-directed RNA polymerase specialized sigma24 family protein
VTHDPWSHVLDDLRAWHFDRDRRAGQRAIALIEGELRRRIPAAAYRRWSPEQVEDTLQRFLARLVERPLPPSVENPRAYLTTAFRNACIDVERGRARVADEPWDDELVAVEPRDHEDAPPVEAALASLSLDDRLVIKMTEAPELLNEEELAALARRCHCSVQQIDDRVRACPSIYDLTLLFDPFLSDGESRRDRMERFRKRRVRARNRLRDALGGSP